MRLFEFTLCDNYFIYPYLYLIDMLYCSQASSRHGKYTKPQGDVKISQNSKWDLGDYRLFGAKALLFKFALPVMLVDVNAVWELCECNGRVCSASTRSNGGTE